MQPAASGAEHDESADPGNDGISRREFVRRAAVAVCVLAAPAVFAACGSSSSAGDGGSGTTTQSTRVSIDSSRCEGCGRCVTACRHGVFATDQSSGLAYVADAGSCEWCGECLSACSRGAISLGG